MPTENHGLNTPQEGTLDWHVPLNENFSQLDSLMSFLSADGQSIDISSVNAGTFSADDVHGVKIADTASDIQKYSDKLNGSSDSSRPGGGVIKLKRKEYKPESTVVLRRGVTLLGQQPERRATGDHHTWQYCVISGENIPKGDPIIKTESNQEGRAVTMKNIVVRGNQSSYDDIKHGIFIDDAANAWLDKVMIERCYGHGLWIRGGYNTYVSMCYVDGGDYRNGTYGCYVAPGPNNGKPGTQMKASQTIFTSSGYSGGNGNDAMNFASSRLNMQRCRLTSRNNNNPSNPRVASFRRGQEDGSGGSPPLVGGGTSITTGGSLGVDGIILESNIHIDGLKLDKCDTGIRQTNASRNHSFANLQIEGCNNHGIYLDSGNLPQMTNVRVRNTGGDGIVFDNGYATNTLSNVRVVGNSGTGLNNTGLRTGEIIINGGCLSGNGSRINNPGEFYVRQMYGFTNVAEGTVTVPSGSSSVSVNHQMDDDLTDPRDIYVTPHSSFGTATNWWVSDPSSGDGSFDINLDADPQQDVSFSWRTLAQSAVRSKP